LKQGPEEWARIGIGVDSWQAYPFGSVLGEPLPAPAYFIYSAGAKLDVIVAVPQEDLQSNTYFDISAPVPLQYIENGEIEYEGYISLPVEEYFEIAPIWESDINGFPFYGGEPTTPWNGFSAQDGPRAYKIRYFEQTREGHDMQARIEFRGASAIVTSTINGVYPIDQYSLNVYLDQLSEFDYTVNHTCAIDLNGLPVGTPNANLVDEDYWSFNGGFIHVTTSPTGQLKQTGFDVFLGPPREYLYQVQLREFHPVTPHNSVPYSGSQPIRYKTGVNPLGDYESEVEIASPDLTVEVTQRDAYGDYIRNGAVFFEFTDRNIGDAQLYLDDPAWATSPESNRDWRLLISGTPYVVGSLKQKNPYLVHNINDDFYELIDGQYVGLPFYEISQTNADKPFKLKYIGQPFSFLGYRYVRIPVTIISEDYFEGWARLKIDSKTFEIPIDNNTTILEFDLLKPKKREPAEQARDTTWPLNSDAQWESTFGVGKFQNMSIEVFMLSVERKVRPTQMILTIKDHARFYPLSAFEHWVSYNNTHQAKRFLWTDVDGKIGFEKPDMLRVPPGVTGYSWLTIDQVMPTDPWFEVQLAPNNSFPDQYHNRNRDAIFLGGNGSIAKGTGEDLQWIDTLGLNILQVQAIEAQSLWDSVEGYPLIGNPFDRDEYSDAEDDFEKRAMPVRVRKHLRWRAWGQAQDGMGGKKVKIIDPDDNSEITEATVNGVYGWFYTGSVRTPKDYRILLDIDNPLSVLIPKSVPRYWHRVGFVETDILEKVAANTHDASRNHILSAYSAAGGFEFHRRDRDRNDSIGLIYGGIKDMSLAWVRASQEIGFAIVKDNGRAVYLFTRGGETESLREMNITTGAQKITHAVCPTTERIVVGCYHPEWQKWKFFVRHARSDEAFTQIGELPVTGDYSDGSLVFAQTPHWHLSFTYIDGNVQRIKRSYDCGETWENY
jgi:hypothetical protein